MVSSEKSHLKQNLDKNCHRKISDQNASKCNCTVLLCTIEVNSFFEYLSNGFQGYVIKYPHRKRSCPYKSFEQVQVLVAPLLLQKWWWGSHVYWQLHSYCDSFLPTRLLGPTRLLRFYKCSLPKL